SRRSNRRPRVSAQGTSMTSGPREVTGPTRPRRRAKTAVGTTAATSRTRGPILAPSRRAMGPASSVGGRSAAGGYPGRARRNGGGVAGHLLVVSAAPPRQHVSQEHVIGVGHTGSDGAPRPALRRPTDAGRTT